MLAALALLVGLVFWRASSRPSDGRAGSASSAAGGSAGAPSNAGGATWGGPGAGGGGQPGGAAAVDDPAARAAASAAQAEAQRRARSQTRRWNMVGDALELNRFPPDSRPLTAEMGDVLHPYSRYETPLPIRPKTGRGEKFDENKVPWVLFTGPRFLVSAGKPLEATLEVYSGPPKEGQAGERIAVQIVSAQLLKFGQPDFKVIGAMPLNDDGQSGDARARDLVYGVAVDPATLPGLAGYNGQLLLTLEVRVPGVDQPAQLRLDYMMTSAPPAVFTGVFADKLVPQGLEISVQVDVRQNGYYYTQGLLFDSKGKPIGFAVARNTWNVGVQSATFTFFGLLFHEAHAEPPFVLKTLTGSRLPDDGEPFKVELPLFEGEYRTKAYALSDFSSAEWESPEKGKLVSALTDLAEKNPDKQVAPPASGSAPTAPGTTPAKP